MPDEGCITVLKALADETRWRIVQALLAAERANVTELVERLHVSQPNMSKHLKILRKAGVVIAEKEGTVVWCRVAPEILPRIKGEGETLELELGCCRFRFDDSEGK